jgi:hypothetical protein
MFWFTKPKYHCIYSKEAFRLAGLFVFYGLEKLEKALPLTGCAAEAELFLHSGELLRWPAKKREPGSKTVFISAVLG